MCCPRYLPCGVETGGRDADGVRCGRVRVEAGLGARLGCSAHREMLRCAELRPYANGHVPGPLPGWPT